MTETDDYLARLDEALRDVPHGVASEIRDGIAEELQALDASAAAARIEQLGDPDVIAREALSGATSGAAPAVAAPTVVTVPGPPVVAARTPLSSHRGFAIVAALVLGFGGFIVPFVGWIVGIVLVCFSTLWRWWEKLVAILAPVVAVVIVGLLSLPAYATTGEVRVTEAGPGGGSSGFHGPSPEDFDAVNPLLPGLGTWHLMLILPFVVAPLAGLWLLWRLRGRGVR